MRLILMPVLALALCLGIRASEAADGSAIRVDVALVLADDVSGSMTDGERQLQRDGFAAAFRNPALLWAIDAGTFRRIAVEYVEWAGPGEDWTVVPWTVISDRQSAETFADRLSAASIARGHLTSMSDGLLFAAGQFAKMDVDAERMTIDISGDGPNNAGPSISTVRDLVVARGITINGLPLDGGERALQQSSYGLMYNLTMLDLDAYFADCVIGGPDAFIMPVASRSQLFAAIQRKVILEIAAAPARVIPAALTLPASANLNCDAERDIQLPP